MKFLFSRIFKSFFKFVKTFFKYEIIEIFELIFEMQIRYRKKVMITGSIEGKISELRFTYITSESNPPVKFIRHSTNDS